MLKLKAPPLPLKKKLPVAAGKSATLRQQLRSEFLIAIKRFIDSAGGGKFSRTRLLYSRPWFLVCGPEGSGKSTLLNNTGISWTAIYPDEQDGHVRGAGNEPVFQWRFSNEAVWIDMAGSLLEDGAAEDFQIFIETMARLRPRRPLDGIVLVTDCGVMLDAEMQSIKNKGESLRKHIDQIMKQWGIELPIYCILSNADKITGFNSIFSDPMGKWNERTLGAALPASSFTKLPKTVFLEELYFILESIREIQVKMLARDPNQANRRLICQFPIKIESLREKIACFISVLFKKSDAFGKPQFGGFFFTSSQSENRGMPEADDHIFDISRTIINHPLNPHKKKRIVAADAPGGSDRSFFAQPLFTSVVPKNAAPISTTNYRYRHDLFSTYWKLGAAIAALAVFSWLVWGSSFRVRTMEKSIQKEFSTPVLRSVEGIRQIGRNYKLFCDFRKYGEKFRTKSMMVTGYDAKRTYASVKNAFFSSVYLAIVQPGSAELYDKQDRMVRLSDNSSENDFSDLKKWLQTYIAISDQNQLYKGIIDEKIVAPVLYEMAARSVFGDLKIPADVDSILKNVIREYVSFLQHNKDFPYRIKPDAVLITGVQAKLVRLFNVDAVYAITCNALTARSKRLGLYDIIGSESDAVMQTQENLSQVYTPDGWNGYVRKEFLAASSRLDHVEDWVVGANKNRFSEMYSDPKILYEGLVRRYCEDLKTRWRIFLSSVSMDRFGSLQSGKERLLQMSGAQSDIARLVGRFADWSEQFLSADSGKTDAIAFNQLKDDMAFLRECRNAKLPEYLKHAEAVAVGLSKASEETSISSIFNGREGDPLIAASQFIDNAMLSPLSKERRGFLERLLQLPFRCTIDLLKQPLAKELNGIWQKDVAEVFSSSFDRQYPFIDTDKEAPFDAVMSFFKPDNGKFWMTYATYFKPYIIQNSAGEWTTRNVPGMIPLNFSSTYLQSLKKAEQISKVFFKPDGKLKAWEFSIVPRKQRTTKLKAAKISVGKVSVEVFTQPGKFLKWPAEGKDQTVSLEFTDINDNPGKISMYGSWSLMRLIGSSSMCSGSSFQTQFEVQLKVLSNARKIVLPADLVITDPYHPFCLNVFNNFAIPKAILPSGSP